jgi:hypothetical protein
VNFRITLDGTPAARAKVAAVNERLQNLNPLIQRISVMELAQAQGRIEASGPGWPPTVEQSKGTPLNRNGALLRSLTRGGAGNVWEDIEHGLQIGTGLQTDDGWNIGRMMQQGTGIYGRGTPIKPINGKFLKFVVNGRTIFAREVAGSPRRRFLFISPQDAQRALGMTVAYVRGQETT